MTVSTMGDVGREPLNCAVVCFVMMQCAGNIKETIVMAAEGG